MQRRTFLRGAGAVTVMVAGGEVWGSWAQEAPEIGEGPAYEPWRTWQQDSSRGPLALVRAAILSANAYNSQPWLFRVSEKRIEVYADVARNLGAFDPYLREMHFSLGCALENLMLAAGAYGYRASLELLPGALHAPAENPQPELAARVELARGPRVKSELFDALPHRHTNRNPMDAARALPPDLVAALRKAPGEDDKVRLFVFTSEPEIKGLVDAFVVAGAKFLADADVQRGVRGWVRTTPEEVQKFRDGSFADARQAGGTRQTYIQVMQTARLIGVIAVRDRYDRGQTIRAGRVWQRAHLLATARGVAGRPANSAIELIDHERRLQMEPESAARLAKFTGDAAWQPTFMFYMGYATVAGTASARRGVESVLVAGG